MSEESWESAAIDPAKIPPMPCDLPPPQTLSVSVESPWVPESLVLTLAQARELVRAARRGEVEMAPADLERLENLLRGMGA